MTNFQSTLDFPSWASRVRALSDSETSTICNSLLMLSRLSPARINPAETKEQPAPKSSILRSSGNAHCKENPSPLNNAPQPEGIGAVLPPSRAMVVGTSPARRFLSVQETTTLLNFDCADLGIVDHGSELYRNGSGAYRNREGLIERLKFCSGLREDIEV